jgi:hypothetical protein
LSYPIRLPAWFKEMRRTALLEVTYRGPLEELAYKISRFKDPPAEVTGLRANTLEISVRK